MHYVSHAAPDSLLFQNGTNDPISPSVDVGAFVRAASRPKEARTYDAGHSLDEQARADLDDWLVRLLG